MVTVELLINLFKSRCESIKIQLDNLDWAKLVFDSDGDLVIENEHGTQFPIDELSPNEIELFYNNIIYD